MLRARSRTYGNIVGHIPEVDGLKKMAEWTARQFEPDLDWDAVRWVRDRWKGTLVLKGILDADDAETALGTGADALIVSNHGGRQLDGASSTIAALGRIAPVVGGRIELHLDGGVRSGQDVLRALALGARGVYVGRPALYGLGARRGAGVARVLDILRRELDLTMAFCGRSRVSDVDRDVLLDPGGRGLAG
jgi:L-lactate dehydrogenase (cytochrome)